MNDRVVIQVARRMYMQAVSRPDGSRVFRGSPRAIMEELGVSSGRRYKGLYTLGFRRIGHGKTAEWLVPPSVP